MEQLEEQLNLAIDHMAHISWWQHPYAVIIMSAGVIIAVITVLWGCRWYAQRARKKTMPQRMMIVLESLLAELEQGMRTPADTLMSSIVILKTYTQWLLRDDRIAAMTDVQWLDHIKQVGALQSCVHTCALGVETVQEVKFNQKQPDVSDVVSFVRGVIACIAETELSEHSIDA
jgi:hypothetical protein